MIISFTERAILPASAKQRRGLLARFSKSFLKFAVVSAAIFSIPSAFAGSYDLFETGQVRPLVMSPDGTRLFALNTPDNRLEVFKIKKNEIKQVGSTPVGLEPVAVAARNNDEVWVVNSVSDSVTILDVSKNEPRVVRTLLVGDEPMDIVFAGDNNSRAFITTAHRGQNSPIDPQLTTPGVGRADVWVFDADALASDGSMGGTPLNIITLFTDSPRALTVSADGSKVYAAGFKTGNQTTVITETLVTDNGGVPKATLNVDTDGDGIPEAHMTDVNGNMQPLTSLIVKFIDGKWVDEDGKDWSDLVKFNLPDKDVFVIDANADVPAEISHYSGVGTILFNMITNPVNGKVYVTNTEALNQNRFTGPAGTLPPPPETPDAPRIPYTTLQGHFAESRITVLDDDVTPIHLNKHINYDVCCEPVPNDENAKSLAQPMDMAISSDGKTLYVAAFGSGKVGVFDTKELENNTFVPDANKQIHLSAGGPAGVVLDEANKRLYVLTRFDNAISIIDTDSKAEIDHIAMYNPEPANIIEGRRYLYDAALTSSHGDSSCALCHVFGDMDQLAWDLGGPGGSVTLNPSSPDCPTDPVSIDPDYVPDPNCPSDLAINHKNFGLPVSPHFAPVKGPMTTQSLRGMANHGPMHWRGDKTDGNHPGENFQPDTGIYNEHVAFTQFNEAFVNLHGRDSELSADAMNDFANFALELMYPPNPIRHLDNSLTPAQQAGHDFFFDPTKIVDTAFHCNGCHVVDRTANEGSTDKPGFFGTDGKNTFAFIQQFLKVPHLRNMYNKVGMFGMANNRKYLADDPFTGMPEGLDPFNNPDDFNTFFQFIFYGNPNPFMGDQIKGFGYTQEGAADTMFRFHNTNGFLPRAPGTVTPLDPGNGFDLNISPEGMQIRRNLEQYLMVFDTNFFPIMGQQVTLIENNNKEKVKSHIKLLMDRADLGECDLIARSNSGDGYLYVGGNSFTTNKTAAGLITAGQLRSLAIDGNTVTFTCTPPGSGTRIALDRDEDGALDGDELSAGTDPAVATSVPAI
jgi:DNA-binding beta-propeller fold protein YncE